VSTYHPLLDGPITVIVSPPQHPKVSKGGPYAADIATHPGEPIYAPAKGKIPHAYDDVLDGGVKGGVMFSFDVEVPKGTKPVRFFFAHVDRASRDRAKVEAGDPIGHATGAFLHVGGSSAAELDKLLSA